MRSDEKAESNGIDDIRGHLDFEREILCLCEAETREARDVLGHRGGREGVAAVARDVAAVWPGEKHHVGSD